MVMPKTASFGKYPEGHRLRLTGESLDVGSEATEADDGTATETWDRMC